MKITVRGHHEIAIAPELGVLLLELAHEGAEKAEVFGATQTLANELIAEVKALAAREPSPVSTHEVRGATSTSWRPTDNEGRPLPPVHRASTTATVTFTEPVVLADFIADWGTRDGVNLQGVRWELTPETQRARHAEVLTSAVENARERALVIAAAAGFEDMTPVQISDPGLLSSDPQFGAMDAGGYAMKSRMMAAESVELAPRDILVRASIEAVYETDRVAL